MLKKKLDEKQIPAWGEAIEFRQTLAPDSHPLYVWISEIGYAC